MLENASVKVELGNQANVMIQSQGQIPTEEISEIGYISFNNPETATQRLTQERSMAIKESLQSGQPYTDSDQVRPTHVKTHLFILEHIFKIFIFNRNMLRKLLTNRYTNTPSH